MKKFLLTLALTVMCAFGLTACGNAATGEETLSLTAEDAEAAAESTLTFLNEVVISGQTEAADYENGYLASGKSLLKAGEK